MASFSTKACLQRAQLLRRAEALDGRDLVALGVGGEHQAGLDRLAVEEHRAGAAGAAVADLLGAGEVEVVAQRVEQRHPRLDGHLPHRAVHLQVQRDGVGPQDLGGLAPRADAHHRGGGGAHAGRLQEAPPRERRLRALVVGG